MLKKSASRPLLPQVCPKSLRTGISEADSQMTLHTACAALRVPTLFASTSDGGRELSARAVLAQLCSQSAAVNSALSAQCSLARVVESDRGSGVCIVVAIRYTPHGRRNPWRQQR